MRVNVFEGSRRILYVAMALYAIGGIAFCMIDTPYVSIDYRILAAASPPARGDCDADDTRHSENMATPGQKLIWVTVCFQTLPDPDGTPIRYVEISSGPGAARVLAPAYSAPAEAYETRRTKETFTQAEAIEADRMYQAKLRAQWVLAGELIAGGLIALWAGAFILGWIVRGFMGIPKGADSRPSNT